MVPVLLAVGFLFCTFESPLGIGSTKISPSDSHRWIAPVFGMMLAQRVFSVWNEFPKAEREKPFRVVFQNGDNGALAHDFLSYTAERSEQDGKWREFKEGLSIYEAKAVPAGGKVIFITIVSAEEVSQAISAAGDVLIDQFRLFELEFAKDDSGRQIFDLDDPKLSRQILERLVQRGMNPVSADPLIREAIDAFRAERRHFVVLTGRKPD